MTEKLCGSNKPGILISSGNKMTIRFKSDISQNAKGFFANYKVSGIAEVKKISEY